MNTDASQQVLSASKKRPKTFQFDKVFGPKSTQSEVYEAVDPLVESAVNGYNATIFAYGSTGSGKTHTISGPEECAGIVPRAIQRIFELAEALTETDSETMVLIHMGYVELYNNQFRSLLEEDQGKIEMHSTPSGDVFLSGSPSLRIPVTNASQAMKLVKLGSQVRMTGTTDCNERSSRSHSILTFHIESRSNVTSVAKLGKLHLVDLAGSERLSLSKASGSTLTETQNINLSLSTLGDVLSALSKLHTDRRDSKKRLDKTLIPYRNSKLTYLLKDSLGGNSKTIMIANVRTPHQYRQQTLMTLMYASRAKQIQNRIIVNTDTKGDSESAALAAEVQRLKEQLRKREAAFELISKQQLYPTEGGGVAEENRMKQLARLSKENQVEKERLESCLRQVVHNHTSTLAVQQLKYNDLQTKLVQYKEVFDKQRVEIETLRDSIRELSFGATEEEVKQMKTMVEDLARALSKTRQESYAKSQVIEQLKRDSIELESRSSAQLIEIRSSMKSEQQDLEQELITLQAKYMALKDASVDALNEVGHAQNREIRLQEELSELRSLKGKVASDLEVENRTLKKQLQESEAAVERLRTVEYSQREKYEKTLSHVESQVQEIAKHKDQMIRDLQEDNSRYILENKRMKKELTDQVCKVESEELIKDLRKESGRYKLENERMKKENEELVSEKEKMLKAIKANSQLIQDVQQENSSFASENQRMKQENDNLAKEKKDLLQAAKISQDYSEDLEAKYNDELTSVRALLQQSLEQQKLEVEQNSLLETKVAKLTEDGKAWIREKQELLRQFEELGSRTQDDGLSNDGLSTRVKELNREREELLSKVAMLEQGLEDQQGITACNEEMYVEEKKRLESRVLALQEKLSSKGESQRELEQRLETVTDKLKEERSKTLGLEQILLLKEEEVKGYEGKLENVLDRQRYHEEEQSTKFKQRLSEQADEYEERIQQILSEKESLQQQRVLEYEGKDTQLKEEQSKTRELEQKLLEREVEMKQYQTKVVASKQQEKELEQQLLRLQRDYGFLQAEQMETRDQILSKEQQHEQEQSKTVEQLSFLERRLQEQEDESRTIFFKYQKLKEEKSGLLGHIQAIESDYQAKLQQLETEQSDWETEKSRLLDRIQAVESDHQASLQQLEAEQSDWEEEKSRLLDRIQAVESDHQASLQQLETEKSDWEEEKSRLLQQIETLQSDHQSKLHQLQEDKSTLQQSNARLNEKVVFLEGKLASLQPKLSSLHEALEHEEGLMKQELKRASKEREILRGEIEQKTVHYKNREAEFERQCQEYESEKTAIQEKYETQLKQAEAEQKHLLAALDISINSDDGSWFEQVKSKLEQSKRQHEDHYLKELERISKENETKMMTLQQDKEQLQKQLTSALKDCESTVKLNELLTKTAQDLEVKKESIETKVAECEQVITELKHSKERGHLTIENHQSLIDSLQDQLQEKQSTLDEHQILIASLKSQVEDLSSEKRKVIEEDHELLTDAKKQIAVKQRELSELQAQHETLERKLQIQNEWLADLRAQRNLLEQTVVESRQEGEKLRDDLSTRCQLEAELKLLKTANTQLEGKIENLDKIRSSDLHRFKEKRILERKESEDRVKVVLNQGILSLYSSMENMVVSLLNGTKGCNVRLENVRTQVERVSQKLSMTRSNKKKLALKLATHNQTLSAELGLIRKTQQMLLTTSYPQKENSSIAANSKYSNKDAEEQRQRLSKLGEYKLSVLNACLKGNISLLKNSFVVEFLPCDFTDDSTFLPLHRTISGYHFHGDVDKIIAIVEVLVKNRQVPIDSVDQSGNTVLHKAIQVMPSQVVVPVVEVLVNLGADANIHNKLGDTPLHTELRRLRSNSISIVRTLVAAGANVMESQPTNCSPLELMEGISKSSSSSLFFQDVLDFLRSHC